MSGKFDLSEYKDVAERIRDFRDLHPYGSLQSEVLRFPSDDLPFVVVMASAYRSPDDQRPGIGLAWEPFPGRTPYTKDSELQNAETSAWGRAIVAALASDTKQGVASADEIRARRSEPHSSPPGGAEARRGSDTGAPAAVDQPAGAPPSSGDKPGAAEAGAEGDGEAPSAPVEASPEQRDRLMQVYKRPSAVKARAAELFGYDPKSLVLLNLSSSEVEALILEAAS